MAKPVCDIYPGPAFVQEAKEGWELLANAFEDGRNVKKREGYDARNLRWASNQLKAMLPMDIEKALRYVEEQGWARLDKTASEASGRPEYSIAKLGGDKEGEVSAVLKDYLMSNARGARALAGEFMAKAANGQDVRVEGLRLARQLRAMGTMGEMILGFDQRYGRGMRAQMLRKAQTVELGDGVSRMVQDAGGAQRASNDILTRIANQLNSPSESKAALDELMKMAEMVTYVNDPMAIAKAGLGLNFASNAWKEVFMNGLLSSPDTLLANASGAIWVPMRFFAEGVGAGMARLSGTELSRQQWVESTAKIASLYQSFGDALQLAWAGFKDNRFMYADPSAERVTNQAIRGVNAQAFAKANNFELSDGWASVVDQIGAAINLPGRALLATDEFARHIALRGEVTGRAVQKAAVEGIDLNNKAALDDAIKKELDAAFSLDPETGRQWFYSDAYDKASALDPRAGGKRISTSAREGIFQEENSWATAFGNLPGVQGPLKPMVPFVKTPLNILRQGIKETTLIGPLLHVGGAVKNNILSPTGIILDLQKRMLNNPADTARITGQITLMTTVGAWMYSQAMAGNITGGGPERFMDGQNKRVAQAAWERNNVAYSFKAGKQSIPFTRFPEPVATMMKIVADLGMASAYMTQSERDETFGVLMAVSATGLYNSSMLSGLNNLISIAQNTEDVDRKLGAATQRYMATQVPFGGALAFIDRAEDPYKSAYQAPSFTSFFTNWGEAFSTGIFGKVADRFPGGGEGRPLQIDQIGGEPIPIMPGVGPGGLNPLLAGIPGMPRNTPSDPAWQAIYDIRLGWQDWKPEGIELLPQEQARLNELMGQRRIGGVLLRDAILRFRRRSDVDEYVRNRGAYATGRAEQIQRELNKLRSDYGQAAFRDMLRSNPNLVQRDAVNEQIKGARRQNDVGQVRTLQRQLDGLLERARRGY